MKGLKISQELELPAEAVTETFGLLAVRGAGKSNAARVMAEEMFKAGLPFVAVDPVGSWRGLRASRDGKGPGLAIPIFGGRWGDVPLERGGGQLLADLVVEQRLSCVLDLTTLDSEASKKIFLLDFARRLYARNEDPLHLFLEEADDYIPQRPMRDEAQLLRAWENIVRRGRAKGLGCTLITQRSAAIAKDVLTQVQTLIAMRTTGPQDVAAIAAWLKYHAQGEEILESLSTLKAGEAWVWSPVFLGKTERIRFRLSSTFDSGATPKAGKVGAARAAATLADVDLADIQKRMAATIERAKAEDPRELRKRIADLERELRDRSSRSAAITNEVTSKTPKRIEVSVLKPADAKRLEAAIARLEKEGSGLAASVAKLDQQRDRLAQAQQTVIAEAGNLREQLRRGLSAPATAAQAVPTGAPRQAPSGAGGPRAAPHALPPSPGSHRQPGNGVGRGGLHRILVALADRPRGLSARQLGLRARLSSRSGTFDTYLARARSAGWISGSRDLLGITDTGRASLGDYMPPPSGQALLEQWLGEMGSSGAGRMLRALAEVYPKALSRTELAEAAGLTGNSGTFDTYLARLRGLQLIEGRAELRAAEELFA